MISVRAVAGLWVGVQVAQDVLDKVLVLKRVFGCFDQMYRFQEPCGSQEGPTGFQLENGWSFLQNSNPMRKARTLSAHYSTAVAFAVCKDADYAFPES